MRRRVVAGALGVLAFSSATALAAPSTEDIAAARALFEQAKKLALDGKWEEACPKLDQSRKLDPRPLTVYRLADCHEHIGRTASAWMEFLEAADLAKAAGEQVKADDAAERAKKLENKVPKLIIVVIDDSPDLVVTQDSKPVSKARFGTPSPVDPGEHVVAAHASKKVPFEKKLTLAADGQVVTVTIGRLENEATQAPVVAPAPVEIERPSNGPSRKTIGLVAMGVGVVGLAVGTVFAFTARSKDSDADAHCLGSRCDAEGKRLSDDARSYGNYATIAFGVGAAAAIGGAVLYLTAPAAHTTAWYLTPSPLPYGAAVTFGGIF